jgi:hypothetical protein
MSNINGASGQHYISNAEFLVWMQEKTDSIYTKMGDAMDVSNDRADAEDALNKIKAQIADVQAGKGDPNELYGLMDETMHKYGDAFPEVNDTLGSISQELKDAGAQLPGVSPQKPYIPAPPPQTLGTGQRDEVRANPDYQTWVTQHGEDAKLHPELVIGYTPKAVTIDKETAERWTNKIKDQVEDWSKQDQLGLINIQEYNAQLNQAKQTASALMDASDKAANAIINHIS